MSPSSPARPSWKRNDTIEDAVRTYQGRANYPESYVDNGIIGDGVSSPLDESLDIDIYQIELGLGDRVTVDIDANEIGTGLDSRVADLQTP